MTNKAKIITCMATPEGDEIFESSSLGFANEVYE
jgi:hypothetical protein